ncbi:ATPase [Parvularcula sp. ZS-1/3]|uniref:ATPase n=1 Tax=Parvularcula mediterranea TaxID=2732508 RepID=A0A7Y3RJP5_9PROT|nr:ATPase [Parvularcula mediterranea]
MTEGPKRFYKEVSLLEQDGGYAVALDGRIAKTVGRHPLVATKKLAEALREEWDAQTDTVRMETMPLTRLHGFVLDAGEQGKAEFTDTICQYAGSDLLCYRADEPKLAERQEQIFGPFLARAEEQGLTFAVTAGIIPVEQPPETIEAMRDRLSAMELSELYPRKLLTEILGSAVLALYADQEPDNAFAAARLDEAFQAEKWGVDGEAKERENALRRDFDDVLRYLSLSR